MVTDWENFLLGELEGSEVELLRNHGRTGRPLGGEEFVKGLEKATGRVLRRQQPGLQEVKVRVGIP
jgi:putative transposase